MGLRIRFVGAFHSAIYPHAESVLILTRRAAQTFLIRVSNEAYARQGAIPRDFGESTPLRVRGISKRLKQQLEPGRSWTSLVRESRTHLPRNLS